MFRFVVALASVGFVEFAAVFGGWVSAADGVEPEIKAAMAQARIPFVENGGQISDQNVAYHAETFAGGVVVEKGGAVAYHVSNAESGDLVVRERYCDDALSPRGIHPSTAKVSYFRGNDPKAWQSGLPTFEAISLGEISDGISLVVEAHNNNVEKIFTVAPGAHPRSISAQIEGIEGLRVLPNGELELRSERGPFCFSSPIAYQKIDGRRHDVKVAYTLRGDSSYGFEVGEYDPARPLVIDPIIASTYIGFSDADYGRAVVVDPQGNVYVAGHSGNSSSSYPDYPTTSSSYQPAANCAREVVVSKFDPTLHTLSASTFIGGTAFDTATAMAIEVGTEPGEGNHIVVAGLTSSDGEIDGCSVPPALSFPTTAGAFDEEHNGSTDVFVLRLSDDLSTLEASTLIGGSHMEHAFEPGTGRGPDLAMDTGGNIYVAGTTYSFDFPNIPTGKELPLGYVPFQASKNGDDEAFVIKLNNSLSNLLGWTYLGGSLEDRGTAVAVGFFDGEWHIFVSGHTESPEGWLPPPYVQFPITPLAFDATHNSRSGAILEDGFVSRFDTTLQVLEGSTFIGGNYEDRVWDMAVDHRGWVYIAGGTGSGNFPTTPGAFMEVRFAAKNGFVAKLDASLTMLASGTLLGGIGDPSYAETYLYGVAQDYFGTVWVTGRTYDSYQPTFPVVGPLPDQPWYDPANYKYRDVILSGFEGSLRRLHTSLHVAGRYDQEAWALFPRSVLPDRPELDYVEVTVTGWSEDGSSGDQDYPVFDNDVGFSDSYDDNAANDDVLVTTFRVFYPPIFEDGFELGNTSAWTNTAP